MIGQLFIDGLDAYQQYGVFITLGGYDGLMSYPSLKPVDINNWPDEDGVEADLSDPKLDIKEFSISFSTAGRFSNVGGFIRKISDGAYHTFDFSEVGIIRSLRLVSNPDYSELSNLKIFSLQLADDFPLQDYVYAAPNKNEPSDGFVLDEVDMSIYGVRILDGLEAISKTPAVKKNLLTNIDNENGATYDGQKVVFEAKDVTLNCFYNGSLTDFWHNYNALLYDLVRPYERILAVSATGYQYPCYYKSCAVKRFELIGEKVWCDFDINLVFTTVIIDETEYLLATEDGEFIVTEDDELIDLNYDIS
ncbi:MAG: hypothetical protein WC833_08640 [Bacteroidales bacterium]|jgi:hypothetical protein